MAKKKQNKTKTVQDAATLSRINFLHQAAHIVPLPLQRHYLTTSKVAMKKTMVKLYPLSSCSTHDSDPKLKRLTCRRCSALLSPQTGNIITRLAESLGGKGDEMLEIECRHCNTKRRFNMSETFTLYTERGPVEETKIH
jgi:RNase P subunit RPR2